jgi:hypothetical protein
MSVLEPDQTRLSLATRFARNTFVVRSETPLATRAVGSIDRSVSLNREPGAVGAGRGDAQDRG